MSDAVRLKDALRKALGSPCVVYHYNDLDDFNGLWSDTFTAEEPILLIWDAEPLAGSQLKDDRLLGPHLTPLDWALAWSLKLARDRKTVPAIIIIDLTAGSQSETWAWRMRHQLLADLPWVTLTAPNVTPDLARTHGWTFAANSPEGKEGVIWKEGDNLALRLPNIAKKLTEVEQRSLQYLMNNWASSLRNSDENHDINNIVGAYTILTFSFEDRQTWKPETIEHSALIDYFLTKISWSGLIENHGLALRWPEWTMPPGFREMVPNPIDILVYDDKYDRGWSKLVEHAISATDDEYCSVFSMNSPDELIDYLESERACFTRRIFGGSVLPLTEIQEETPPFEIFFLDLRLYDESNLAGKKESFERLLNIARSLLEDKGLAWPAISQAEITSIQLWLDAGMGRNDPRALRAYLLLPRLLALAMPLVPIILFSSTRQLAVREALQHYRNIFIGFHKPNPFADPESVSAAAIALNCALDMAFSMIERHCKLFTLQKIYEASNQSWLEDKGRPESIYADIYIDEAATITTGIISAVACNIYSDKSWSDLIQKELIDEFRKDDDKAIVWAPRKVADRQPVYHGLRKASDLWLWKGDKAILSSAVDQAWKNIVSLIKFLQNIRIDEISSLHMKDRWAISAIRAPRLPTTKIANNSLYNFFDHPLDDAIKLNIEFMILCYLPRQSDKWEVQIHLPTRSLKESDVRKEFANQFQLDKFSVPDRKTRQYNQMVQTYATQAAFPLVRGWLRTLGDGYEFVARRVIGIRGRKLGDSALTYFEASNAHLFHDIADWAAGSVAVNADLNDARAVALRKGFKDAGLYPNRFVSASTGDAGVACFRDLQGLLESVATIIRVEGIDEKSFFETDIEKLASDSGTLQSARAAAMRIVDCLPVLASPEGRERLMASDAYSHHRLAVWRLMGYLRQASGEALMP